MHDKLPDSELAVFAGAGHSPMIEFPEQFNDLALRFVAARNGDQGSGLNDNLEGMGNEGAP